MNAAKDEVLRILERLPEDASLEDIQYHIYVRQKIDHGLADAEAGRTLSGSVAAVSLIQTDPRPGPGLKQVQVAGP